MQSDQDNWNFKEWSYKDWSLFPISFLKLYGRW